MINKLWQIFWQKKFLKFLAIGVINTLIYNGFYIILIPKINYIAASIIAFAISLIVSFFLNCYITFKVRPTLDRFIQYPLTNIPNLIVLTLGLYIIVEIFMIPEEFAGIIAIVIAIPFTYLIMRIVMQNK